MVICKWYTIIIIKSQSSDSANEAMENIKKKFPQNCLCCWCPAKMFEKGMLFYIFLYFIHIIFYILYTVYTMYLPGQPRYWAKILFNLYHLPIPQDIPELMRVLEITHSIFAITPPFSLHLVPEKIGWYKIHREKIWVKSLNILQMNKSVHVHLVERNLQTKQR